MAHHGSEPFDGTPERLLAKAKEARSQAAIDVLDERARQISVEGWTPNHDDNFINRELPRAAACYTQFAHNEKPPAWWPWDLSWWKPTTPRRNLVKAGALILAEIERLDRAAQPPVPK